MMHRIQRYSSLKTFFLIHSKAETYGTIHQRRIYAISVRYTASNCCRAPVSTTHDAVFTIGRTFGIGLWRTTVIAIPILT